MVKSLRQALRLPGKAFQWVLSRLDAEHSIIIYRSEEAAAEEDERQLEPGRHLSPPS
jgi:hypothetical protein